MSGITFNVTLRNAAGREIVVPTYANTGNQAASRAIREAERKSKAGERWYAVTCEPRGREIRL